ncbi:MAG: zinc ribbon domain-containing protein [Phycisphaerae bacterium]
MQWADLARHFFYAVMLSDHVCPDCGGGLMMAKEGQCCCEQCGKALDPTVEFQQCTTCGGPLVLSIRRYRCRQCGADVPSRFLFDGLVFDGEYFRHRMIESRQRRAELREQVRQMLANSRSLPLGPVEADLGQIPGLIDALNSLTMDLPDPEMALPTRGFELVRYEVHLQAHIGPIAITFEQIPPLCENLRQDRIRRFIALLFMAQAGIVDLWQDGPIILVKQHDPDAERSRIPGEAEATA